MHISHSFFLLGALAIITLALALISFWPGLSNNSLQGIVGDTNGVTNVSLTLTPLVSPSRIVLLSMSPSVSPRPSISYIPDIIKPIISSIPFLAASLTPTPTVVMTPTSAPTPSTVSTVTPIPIETAAAVVINEIGWMGTKDSATDEWIELYNPTNQEISLTGWVLYSQTDDSPHITLTKTIGPGSYYLLERTKDTVISDISADFAGSFGQGGLKNEGEKLVLNDKNGKVVDMVDCSSKWFAGDNVAKASMERLDPLISGSDPQNWRSNNGKIINGKDASGNVILGTPKSKNSVSQ